MGANAGIESDKELLKKLGIHASETAWVGGNIDVVVDNNGSIDDLYSQIQNMLR
jgi:dephospho-CoA kinase